MWIAQRVHIAGGASHIGWDIHQTNSLRRLHPSGFADVELGVARILQKRRQPSQLQLRAAVNQYISAAQCNNEARTRIHEMRVFGWLRQHCHVHVVASNLPRQGAEVWKGGDDVQLPLRRQCAEENRQD